jgi:thiol-disulfide isomerase/thioredoxin
MEKSMKFKFLLMLSVLSVNAFALPEELATMFCRDQIEKVIKKAGSKDKWVRTVDPQQGILSFRTPTKTFAKWVEVQTFDNPYVFVFENSKTRVHQFDKKTCLPLNDSDVKPLSFLKTKKEGFTDKQFQALVESDKPSLVYVWSPTMVYSMREMHVFQQVAKELGVAFVPVLHFDDSAANAKQVISEAYKQNIEVVKNNSLELYMREADVHFPTSYVAGNGRVSKQIFGVLTHELFTARLKKELALLQEVEK